MTKKPRVRFAPSPTGPLHIGGIRTALYNYLFAKQSGGTFVLRIEDTDQQRTIAEAEEYIFNALEWCGISPDESININEKFGPYRQSERKNLYQDYAVQLVKKGFAYYAFDSKEELDNLRKKYEEEKQTFTYNSNTRKTLSNSINLSKEEIEKRLNNKENFVIRFKVPENETLVLEDIIRGKISIQTNALDDKIIFKSDGLPTYHLANVVDDHLMEISHVIRGEEWLPSLALHVLLYKAFDWKLPDFAHLPLILKPSGNGKLSKRDGEKYGFPVFPLKWKSIGSEKTNLGYKEEGYFPEAMINYLAFLGWNPGTEQELFSLDELIHSFNFEQVNKAGAKFNLEKIQWFNQQYLKQKSPQELLPILQKSLIEKQVKINDSFDLQVIDLIQERCVFAHELWETGAYFYNPPTTFATKDIKKAWKDETPLLLGDYIAALKKLECFAAEEIHNHLQDFVKTKDIGFGKIMMPIRLLLMGSLQGPEIPKSLEILGKDESIMRLSNRSLTSKEENA